MKNKYKLVNGIAINDSEKPVYRYEIVEGKSKAVWKCPAYCVWRRMIERCYCEKWQKSRPSYAGCSVYEPWLRFSVFREWMFSQDWQGKQLDKDLSVRGNKIYSPQTCLFVSSTVNQFIVDGGESIGVLPIGAAFGKIDGTFYAKCGSGISGKRDYLGSFRDPLDAHKAWQKRKHDRAMELAEIQEDPRVARALMERYAPGTCHL